MTALKTKYFTTVAGYKEDKNHTDLQELKFVILQVSLIGKIPIYFHLAWTQSKILFLISVITSNATASLN